MEVTRPKLEPKKEKQDEDRPLDRPRPPRGHGDEQNQMIALTEVERYIQQQVQQHVERARGLEVNYSLPTNHTPFMENVKSVWVSSCIKVPRIDPFDGKTDPADFVNYYLQLMNIWDVLDAILCMMFSTVIKDHAAGWFT